MALSGRLSIIALSLPKYLISLANAPFLQHGTRVKLGSLNPCILVFSNAMLMRLMLIVKESSHIMIFSLIPMYFCLQRYKKAIYTSASM